MDRANRSMKQLNLTELSSKLNITDVLSRIHLNSPHNQLLQIECFLVITCFLFLVLSPARFLRSRHDHWLPKAMFLGASTLILLLIPFVFGLMLSLDFKHDLVPLWASLLLIILIHVPHPPEFLKGLTILVGILKTILYLMYTALLLLRFKKDYLLRRSTLVLIFCSYVAIGESYFVHGIKFVMINTESGMRSFIRCIFEYLRGLPNDDSNTSDDPLRRCKYVVDPVGIKLKNNEIVNLGPTIEDIWRCEDGSLLSSGQNDELKNTCLSYSLVWQLLYRILGVPSNEISQQGQEEAWKFDRLGLLTLPSPLKLIEVELAFLGEFFFSTNYIILTPICGLFHLFKHLMLLEGYIAAVIALFVSYNPGEQYTRIVCNGHDMDVILTAIVIISLLLLQLAQIIVLCNSGWVKVKLICLYVRLKSWRKKSIVLGQCISIAAQILCPVRFPRYKPWQRKLGQFSFLGRCVYYVENAKSIDRPPSSISMLIIPVKRNRFPKLRKASKSETLSSEREKIVIQSLQDRGPQLTNGIGSLEATDLPQETKMKLTLACRHSPKVDTDARVVLLWHIATSVCAMKKPSRCHAVPNSNLCCTWKKPSSCCTWKKHSSCSSECFHFHVATTLSNYCAYLIAFAPKLLPGHAAATAFTCTDAFEDGWIHLKSLNSLTYEKLMEIADGYSPELEATQSILQHGAALGKVLNQDIEEEGVRWKVLADLWAEMILYLAPNANNERAHSERLADGGEFITHLWALLYHVGIVDRDCIDKSASSSDQV